MDELARTRAERNRRRNASLVQTRVPIGTRVRLLREAVRRRTTVSALVAEILARHFSVAARSRKA